MNLHFPAHGVYVASSEALQVRVPGFDLDGAGQILEDRTLRPVVAVAMLGQVFQRSSRKALRA